jgi:hypothetical protein
MSEKKKVIFKIDRKKLKDGQMSDLSVYIENENGSNSEIGSAKIFSLFELDQKSKVERADQFDQCSSSCSEFQFLMDEAIQELNVGISKNTSLVFIEEIIIKPQYQNFGYGSELLLFIIKNFINDKNFLALEACPIGKLESYLKIGNSFIRERQMREDINKLIYWYESFGLNKIKDSDYMILTSLNGNAADKCRSRIKLRAS